jgi:hypothetical protein
MRQRWVVGTVSSLRRKNGFVSLELVEYQRDATTVRSALPVGVFRQAAAEIDRSLAGAGVRLEDGIEIALYGRLEPNGAYGQLRMVGLGVDPRSQSTPSCWPRRAGSGAGGEWRDGGAEEAGAAGGAAADRPGVGGRGRGPGRRDRAAAAVRSRLRGRRGAGGDERTERPGAGRPGADRAMRPRRRGDPDGGRRRGPERPGRLRLARSGPGGDAVPGPDADALGHATDRTCATSWTTPPTRRRRGPRPRL